MILKTINKQNLNLKSRINNICFFAICLFLVFCISFIFLFTPDTRAMGSASDRLSLTWPSTASNHSITFRLAKDLPAGGKILITPQAGEFFISTGFDYRNIDLATSTALNAVFYDRNISTSSSAINDGVNAVASSSNGSIEIDINTSSGIRADVYVNIEIGTNAEYGATGTNQIINPSAIGSYRIEIKTFDASDNFLERAVTMIAIVYPVKTGGSIAKLRSNGTPAGVLNYGAAQTIMSLNTNYAAFCRWSNTASTTYANMTETFSYTGGTYHSSIISGFVNGATYHYYVKCLDMHNVADTTDFEITFMIAGQDGEDNDEDSDGSSGSDGAGPGTGGGSGGGSGGSTGVENGELLPFPELPDSPIVAFQGWAYPGSKVVLLKDGVEEQIVTALNNGSFSVGISELDQGVYTFNLWGEDNVGRKSATQSFTFYVKEGTKTELFDIYLPPTIDVPTPSFDIGDNLEVLGQSADNSNIELWLYPKVVGGVTEDMIIKKDSIVATNGDWNFTFDTKSLINGPYQVKARSSMTAIGTSDFSKIIDLMIGGELPTETCSGADLNGDTKVNITDFSILLYWWASDNACADQNSNGTVDLTDFSIMMYYWTG